ncbi:MAG TPA: DUF4091 domain-containing protein, partial [Kofleriaceae bacterium]|nr:DUF4091 domain-containing protein [Kofleriaceae bacterium]
MLKGTSSARLPGAKLTTVFHREMTDTDVSAWITFAKAHGFYDRLYFYPVDEPTWAGDPASAWNTFKLWSDKVHAIDASSRIILTASMQDAVSRSAATKIDAFVPIINELEDRSGAYAGNQRAKYDAWMSGAAKREMWAYQACPSHGCGMPVGCGTPSKGIEHTGWPNLMIDTSSVQVRAFAWQSFRFRVTNELFWDIASMLNTSWTNQCSYGGHGEGTFFYTGTPARVGGTSHIPVESIRLKMMREGREDYEYLAMVARTNPALANSVANTLFPHSYASAQTAAALESARSQLFDYLDAPALAAEVDRTARIVAGTLQVRSELPAPGTWTSVARTLPRPASSAASSASRASPVGIGSTDSTTPRSPSNPSALDGRHWPSRPSMRGTSARICSSTSSLMRTDWAPPIHTACRTTKTLPRFRTAATCWRSAGSSASQPCGRRQRTSR